MREVLKMAMKRTTITLSEELSDEIELRARIKRRSTSEIIRTLLERALEMEKGSKRELPFIGIADSDEPFDAADLDKFLEENWAAGIEESMKG